MFNFDMLALGVRGDELGTLMSEEELEIYGIDWDGLRDENLLQSHGLNNTSGEAATSWVGRTGPPPHLNEVRVEEPETPEYAGDLAAMISHNIGPINSNSIEHHTQLWITGLACARVIAGNLF